MRYRVGAIVCVLGAAPELEALQQGVDAANFLGGPTRLISINCCSLGGCGEVLLHQDNEISVLLDGQIHEVQSWPEEDARPDTQKVIEAYRMWGPECASRLIGEFAFIIWDNAEQVLSCARDAVGIRPLYWAKTHGRLSISSDPAGLLALPWVSSQLSEEAVARFLLQYGESQQTEASFFQDIKKLPFGHTLRAARENVQVKRYWFPDTRTDDSGDLVSRGREILERSVSRRIRPGDQFAAHLSGGLDSSTLVVCGARLIERSGGSLATYSWAPPPKEPLSLDSEHRRIRRVLEQERIGCCYTKITSQDWADGYFLNPALYPPNTIFTERFVLQTIASHGKTRVLSGWGGDQGISAYGWGLPAQLLERGAFAQLARLAFSEVKPASSLRRLVRLARFLWEHALLPQAPDKIYSAFAPFLAEHPSALPVLRPHFERHARELVRSPARFRRQSCPKMNSLAHFELGSIASRTEAWAALGNRIGPTHTYPLLDRTVVEFALSLPPGVFWTTRGKRAFFRELAEPYLPSGMAWSPALKGEPDSSRALARVMEDGYRIALARFKRNTKLYRQNPWIDVEVLWRVAEDLNRRSHPSDRALVARALQCLVLWEHYC